MRFNVRRITAFAFLVLLSLAAYALSPQDPLPSLHPEEKTDTGPNTPGRLQKDLEKRANEQRQADLKKDTEKLLKLSTELKEYVDKSNEHVLSLDVIKRAEEIEKLAHSVKTKMKGNN
jgi:hypothetical protein